MELKLKTISTDGIAEAISKAELYRYLNEPEESESICHDILAADPENQTALRILGLAITDEFVGAVFGSILRGGKYVPAPHRCLRTAVLYGLAVRAPSQGPDAGRHGRRMPSP